MTYEQVLIYVTKLMTNYRPQLIIFLHMKAHVCNSIQVVTEMSTNCVFLNIFHSAAFANVTCAIPKPFHPFVHHKFRLLVAFSNITISAAKRGKLCEKINIFTHLYTFAYMLES